jgi:hypothetical protein
MQKASSRPGLPKVHAFGMGLFIITLNTYRPKDFYTTPSNNIHFLTLFRDRNS